MRRHPSVIDVIHMLHNSNLSEDPFRVREWHLKPKGAWNYHVAHSMLHDTALGASLKDALAACARIKIKAGRTANEGAISSAFPLVSGRAISRATMIRRESISFRRDISFGVPPLTFAIENSHPKYILLNPKKSIYLTKKSASIVMSAFGIISSINDLDEIPVEIIDVGSPDQTERIATRWTHHDILDVPEAEVNAIFQRYVIAFDAIKNELPDEKEVTRKSEDAGLEPLFPGF